MADKHAPSDDQPSLIGGHVQYVKGAAEELIGKASGSEAWTSSGTQDKAAGVDAMKTAGENRDSAQGFGKAEEIAGRVTGCEGMEKEGKESKKEGQ